MDDSINSFKGIRVTIEISPEAWKLALATLLNLLLLLTPAITRMLP